MNPAADRSSTTPTSLSSTREEKWSLGECVEAIRVERLSDARSAVKEGRASSGQSGQNLDIRRLQVSSWQAAVGFQALILLEQVTLAIWYGLVSLAPNSLSEYRPIEVPNSLENWAMVIGFGTFFAIVLFLTLRGSRTILLVSAVFGFGSVVGGIAYTMPAFVLAHNL